MKEDEKDPKSGREQKDDRATSGGGLGQGRETAAGKPGDQLSDKGRPGKGMGGTSDSSARASDMMPGRSENLRGPVPGNTTSEVRPSKAGKLGRTGGEGIDLGEHDTEKLNQPGEGAEWSRQKGMGPMSMDKDMKEKTSPTNVEKRTSEE
jgi:hypothetical protein